MHTGHIAMAPDDEIPVTNPKTGQVVKTRGYLIEAQTLQGLSGSPVFIRYTNVSGISSGMRRVVGYSNIVHLLRVWQGAWDGMSADILTEKLGRERRVPVVVSGKFCKSR